MEQQLSEYTKIDLTSYNNRDDLRRAWEKTVPNYKFQKSKGKKKLKIISWNVHLFKDVYGAKTNNEIWDFLDVHDPDIILFQETFTPIHKNRFLSKYNIAFHNITFGISIIVRKGIEVTIRSSKLPKGNSEEGRMVAAVQLYDLEIIVTHLDVYDQSDQTRLEQLKFIQERFIDKEMLDRTFIVGDFNLVRKIDYSKSYWNKLGQLPVLAWNQGIKKYGWDDYLLSDFSVWTGRRVDYCLTHNSNNINYRQQFVPTLYSDHLPMFIEIT